MSALSGFGGAVALSTTRRRAPRALQGGDARPGVRGGNDFDIVPVHRRYYDDVVRFIGRRVRDHELAEDLAQETFTRAFVARDRFDTTQPAWPWLQRIAHNLALNAIRDERRHRAKIGMLAANELHAIAASDAVGDPERYVLAEELRRDIARSIDELSPRSRRVLLYRAAVGHDYDQIAALEGVTVESVKATLKRARRDLRLALSRRHAFTLPPIFVTGFFSETVRSILERLRSAIELLASPVTVTSYDTVASVGAATMVGVLMIMQPQTPQERPAPQRAAIVSVAARQIETTVPPAATTEVRTNLSERPTAPITDLSAIAGAPRADVGRKRAGLPLGCVGLAPSCRIENGRAIRDGVGEATVSLRPSRPLLGQRHMRWRRRNRARRAVFLGRAASNAGAQAP